MYKKSQKEEHRLEKKKIKQLQFIIQSLLHSLVKFKKCIHYMFYSFSGLSGIDLGNMLIKKVATKLQKDVPSVTTHSTLSPIPGFRPWLIRNLKGNSEYRKLYIFRQLSYFQCFFSFNYE